jgi:hypothetical protein
LSTEKQGVNPAEKAALFPVKYRQSAAFKKVA